MIQASCERRSNCADSATYEVTDPEPEPNPKTHPNPNPIFNLNPNPFFERKQKRHRNIGQQSYIYRLFTKERGWVYERPISEKAEVFLFWICVRSSVIGSVWLRKFLSSVWVSTLYKQYRGKRT